MLTHFTSSTRPHHYRALNFHCLLFFPSFVHLLGSIFISIITAIKDDAIYSLLNENCISRGYQEVSYCFFVFHSIVLLFASNSSMCVLRNRLSLYRRINGTAALYNVVEHANGRRSGNPDTDNSLAKRHNKHTRKKKSVFNWKINNFFNNNSFVQSINSCIYAIISLSLFLLWLLLVAGRRNIP